MTAIEWADETWNPVTGCDKVSDGCTNCYIERTIPFRMEGRRFDENGRMGVRLHPDRLDKPLHWRKPRRVFVNSLSDLFHPDISPHFMGSVWDTMALAPQHIFQILTKRPQTMFGRLQAWADNGWLFRRHDLMWCGPLAGPLPNVWLGTSIESDRYAFRADWLRKTPAIVRWLSLEPLLGPLPSLDLTGIDWVVVGGESGPRARPMHPDWVRDIRDRCIGAGVAFFFKQWGEWAPAGLMYDTSDRTHLVLPDGTDRGVPWGGWALDRPEAVPMRRFGKKDAGRELDGRTWDEYPAARP